MTASHWRRAIALSLVLLSLAAIAPAHTQSLFAPAQSPPVPPNPIPNVPNNPGPSLATPDGGVTRSIPPPPAAAPAPAALGGAAPASPPPAPRIGGIVASARFSRDAAPISSGLHWRVYAADRPDQAGNFRLVKEERSATPTFELQPGSYIVHVALGLASAAKKVQVGRTDIVREVFDLPAGGARFEGRVADAKIPLGQITFDIYPGSQFDGAGDRRPIASEVPTGDLVLLPEGTYHVVSNYGDGNAVMRYDFRIQAGKLTDARINHRAALITLKLVGDRGGEALANTAWSVLTPGGDVIKESIGAFPTVVLAEGDYVVIARNEGKVFNREFKVEPGFDREIELVAR